MKKIIKALFFTFGVILILFISAVLIVNVYLFDVKLDKDKLVNLDRTINFYDKNGVLIAEKSNGICVSDLTKINNYTKNAFVSIEDKRFYSHNGVDYKSMLRAIKNNFKNLSIKEGGSTISQQLIKNTHLTSEKTIKRKLSEIKLARNLERKYTKDEILEMYLNTIYFGNNAYGITNASKLYFNKNTKDLTINESAILAGMIKAPSIYAPNKNLDKCNKRKNLVLNEMLNQGFITKEEYNENVNKNVLDEVKNVDIEYDYIYLTSNYMDQTLKLYPYSKESLNIYTFYDSSLQKILKEAILNFNNYNCEKTAVLMNNKGQIEAYFSTCGDVNRQIGSVIKPILVYAPAIEENVVTSVTPILDEKTDFSGYTPSNYNDKYYGYITVKESLAKSSNVCSVKLLNYLSVDKAKEYINKTDINLSENDNSLALALGATENGAKLTNLTACYNIFSNKGIYKSPTTISSIKNDSLSFNNTIKTERVINEDTAHIMNDMLNGVVQSGTAKKLLFSDLTLYAKTGTVGNKKGNTDAYVISYDADYTLGVWFGSKNNAVYMDNTITGGNVPCFVAKSIWEKIYANKTQNEMFTSDSVIKVMLDKESFENNHTLVLADDVSPKSCVFEGLLKISTIPKTKSTKFTNPIIQNPKTSVKNYCYCIELCQIEHINALIYKIENNKKYKVFDTRNGEYIYNEKLKPNSTYEFIVVPYYDDGKVVYYGKEMLLDKIKSPSIELDDWWDDKL